MNNICLPEIDTQKLFDLEMNLENYKSLRQPRGCGIYAIFHKHHYYNTCLYVGASDAVTWRASRVFLKITRNENIYMRAILASLDKKSLTAKIKFVTHSQPFELYKYESDYIKRLKPILNIAAVPHSTNPLNP